MGTPGIAGPAAPPGAANPSRKQTGERRSVMARFQARVTVPVCILLFIWAGMTAATFLGVFGNPWWIAGLAVVIVVVTLARTSSFVREMAGENDEATAAIADLHRAALAAATAEAGLRNGLRQVLVSLSRRNQSLIHRQLRIIDKLEKQASGSAELGDLFSLDHLTTRMRRHAESLTVLAGEAPGRSWGAPVPVVDVMRAAAAEVEDYRRVLVRSDSDQSVTAPAVTDMIHLLAELIENATLFSPSSTKVEVRAESVANGFVIEIEDRGLGIPADQLRELNARLAEAPDEELADADRLGLFVAARLAARHGVLVSLNPSAYRGTKAVVVLPAGLVVAARPRDRRLTGEQQAIGSDRLDLQAPGILALAGSEMARRADPVTAGPSVFTPSLESLSSRDSFSSRDGFSSHESFPFHEERLPRRERPREDAVPRPAASRPGIPDPVAPSLDAPRPEIPGPVASRPEVSHPEIPGSVAPNREAARSERMPRRDRVTSGGGLSLADGIRGAGGFSPVPAGFPPAPADYPSAPPSYRSASADFPPAPADFSPAQVDFPSASASADFRPASADYPSPPAPGDGDWFTAPPAKPELPRRVRSRPGRPSSGSTGSGSAIPDSPVPEQARSLASSLQSSWRRSQHDDTGPGLANQEES